MCKKLYSTKPLQSHFVLLERKGRGIEKVFLVSSLLAGSHFQRGVGRYGAVSKGARREREKNFFDGRRLRGVERGNFAWAEGRKSSLLIIFGKVHLPALPSSSSLSFPQPHSLSNQKTTFLVRSPSFPSPTFPSSQVGVLIDC